MANDYKVIAVQTNGEIVVKNFPDLEQAMEFYGNFALADWIGLYAWSRAELRYRLRACTGEA